MSADGLGDWEEMTTPFLRAAKLHGLGNDFLVVIAPTTDPDLGRHGAAVARQVCDRHRGVGADGLIWGRPGHGDDPDGAALTFRLWNADGSDAEMSGNGMRCLAHAALDAGLVSERTPFAVDTPAGRRQVTIARGPRAGETWATVEMGVARSHGEPQRCNVGHGQMLVDMGNPHLVVLGPDPSLLDVAALGPALESTEAGGLNVEFVTLGPGPDEVTMRVWERGVGETQACGTGSCAAAVALHRWGRVGRRVTVHQPGGAVVVELREDATVALSGPSCHVATAEIALRRP